MGKLEKYNANDVATLPAQEELFSKLYRENQRLIYSYIFSVMADKTAADDIFQETGIVLWKKFSEFEEGTSFLHWAKAIAYFKIKEYRKKHSRDKLVLSEELVTQLNNQAEEIQEGLNKRQRQLTDCVQNLPDHNRSIVKSFYEEKKTANELAEKLGRSIFAIRKSIHKIRKKLFECIDHKLRERHE